MARHFQTTLEELTDRMPYDEWPVWLALWETERWGEERLINQLARIGAAFLGSKEKPVKPDELIPRWQVITPEMIKAQREMAKTRFLAWAKSRAKTTEDNA